MIVVLVIVGSIIYHHLIPTKFMRGIVACGGRRSCRLAGWSYSLSCSLCFDSQALGLAGASSGVNGCVYSTWEVTASSIHFAARFQNTSLSFQEKALAEEHKTVLAEATWAKLLRHRCHVTQTQRLMDRRGISTAATEGAGTQGLSKSPKAYIDSTTSKPRALGCKTQAGRHHDAPKRTKH